MRSKAHPLRVLLVDDQVLFLSGLANVLADWPEVQVVAEASNGEDAFAKALALRPDVVLMDLNMPQMNGLEATAAIREKIPEAKIILLTVSEQDENVFRAIRAGASGYLLKDIKPSVLREMLHAVDRGEAPLAPLMAKKILSEFLRLAPESSVPVPAGDLTDREIEVLELVAAGLDNKALAERLVVAPGTVKRHLHNIMTKLHAHSREEAVNYASRHGVIKPPPRI